MTTSVLNTSVITLDNRAQDLAAAATVRGGLAEDLLWYDKVTLVTSSFWEVKSLLRWTTAEGLLDLCVRGELSFVRFPHVFGYVSASGARQIGLATSPGIIGVRSGGDRLGRNNPHPDDWREQMVRVLRDALHWGQRRAEAYVEQMKDSVIDVPNDGEHIRLVRESTDADMNRDDLRHLVLGDDAGSDINDLPDGHPGRSILLRVASANNDLLLLKQFGLKHLHVDPLVEPVLRSKIGSVTPHAAWSESLTRLLELHDMPSVSDAVAWGRVSFDDVVRVRRTPNAARFRTWLEESVPPEGRDDAVRSYIAAIEEVHRHPLPPRVLRFLAGTVATAAADFAATALAGAPTGLAAGIVVNAVDTFLLDGISRHWTPQVFLDDELERTLN